jgi:hypothetical protein
MFARVVELRGVPQTLDRVVEYFNDDIVPAFSSEPGFRSLVVMVNRESATVLGIGFYGDAEAAADAGRRGAAFRNMGALVAGVGVEDVRASTYEVIATAP